mmetsp:Transcript_18631/g.33293  ORF Transcript_18631/g.33293 Transcript_18631/m.33293 type:complete len:228 (-) Transcript_18631:132-815(-)
MHQHQTRMRILERSRSRDDERQCHGRVSELSGSHANEDQGHHAEAGLARTNVAESGNHRRHEQGRRCNSQDIFLSIGANDDVYAWEFGQPYRGAYKTRSAYDQQNARSRGQHDLGMEESIRNQRQRKRWARVGRADTNVELHDFRTGLGVLRDHGPYHNSGPALGDLHRALRRGAGPGAAGKWGHDLFENDDVEEHSGRQVVAVLENIQGGMRLGSERSGRMRAWAD